jgi:NTE family protein
MKNINIFVLALLTLLFILLPPGSLHAADTDPPAAIEEDHGEPLRIGLVLSGGGAKGVAHIGIIKAIEEAGLKIDYITGTSMGALVGGLYAIGYSADQLIELSRTSNFRELFTESPNRRHISNYEKGFDERTILTIPIRDRGLTLPSGIITGQNVYSYLSSLAWGVHGTEDFNEFLIPYAAIGTDIETGEAVVFRSGYLPDAIRASISIPSAFAPHVIDGRTYIDGGLARNLPVQDAIDMGANYTIAVDVSTPLVPTDSLSSLTDIMNQTVLYRINERTKMEREKADMVIIMPELDRHSMIDFDIMEVFLQIGLRKGEEMVDQFRELAEQQSGEPYRRAPVDSANPLPVSHVLISGNTLFDDDFILRKLEFTPGSLMTPQLIDEKISRLYSSQYIEQVTYRVRQDEQGSYNLHIRIQENKESYFKAGLRYETQTQASILLEATFQDLLHSGSINRLDLRLGNEISFGADYIYYGALGSRLAALTSLQYHSEDADWYVDGSRAAQFKSHILRGEVSVGNYFSTQNLFSVGVRKDFLYFRNRLNPELIEPADEHHHALFARYKFDYLNRKNYPDSGHKIVAESYLSLPVLMSPLQFSNNLFYWEGYFKLADHFALRTSLLGGYTYGNELPWGYYITPNKYHPDIGYLKFGGVDRYELSAPNVQMGSIGWQAEPFRHRFINVDFYAGRFMDQWNFDLQNDDIVYGTSLTLGALTILGPIKAIFSTSTFNSFTAELQIGYQF